MQVLARLCDQSLFWELMPDAGEEMICGVGRIGGLYAGFIINRQGLVGDPERPGAMRPGGTLYRAGIAKISAFSRACDSDGIPIVWLQDISGFDIGVEAERQGLLAYGSTSSTPTAPTPCRCSRCCCARPPAPATTPWPACPTTPSSSSAPASPASA
jgi:acetyl-CoA carboxylase carboxyltransferase component